MAQATRKCGTVTGMNTKTAFDSSNGRSTSSSGVEPHLGVRTSHNVREYTRGEEVANSVTHGLGIVLALVATPFLIMRALEDGGGIFLFAAIVYLATMIVEYTMSTLYHAIHATTEPKRVFKVLDHSCIYLFIAGSYTPFCLITLSADGGMWLCVFVVGRSRWQAWRARRSGSSAPGGSPLCSTCFWGGASCGSCRRWWPTWLDAGPVAARGRWRVLHGRLCFLRAEEGPLHAFHLPPVGPGRKRACSSWPSPSILCKRARARARGHDSPTVFGAAFGAPRCLPQRSHQAPTAP